METRPADFTAAAVPTRSGPVDGGHAHVETINRETPGADHEGFCYPHVGTDEEARAAATALADRLGKTVITLRRADDGCFFGLIGNL